MSTSIDTDTSRNIDYQNLKVTENQNLKAVTQQAPSLGGNLMLPNERTFSRCLAKHTKLAQLHVSNALKESTLRAQVLSAWKMTGCGTKARLVGNMLQPLERCHQRSCPICMGIKGRQYTNLIMKSLDNMRYTLTGDSQINSIPTSRHIIGIKVTLNSGTACPLANIRSRLSCMHSVWARMLRTTKAKNAIIGAMRSTEITQTDLEHANPHLHCLLLVRADSDIPALESHIRNYWKRVMRKAVKKSECLADHNTAAAAGNLQPLYNHTKADAYAWIKYSTKGSYDLSSDRPEPISGRSKHRATSKQYWSSLDSAIRGMRLMACTGELKEALSLVKTAESMKPVEMKDMTAQIPTHQWSDHRLDYVPVSELLQVDTTTTAEDVRTDLFEPTPFINFKTSSEFERLVRGLTTENINTLLGHTRNLDSHDTHTENVELLTKNASNEIKSITRIDYHEPDEVIRDSLKVHQKGLNNL